MHEQPKMRSNAEFRRIAQNMIDDAYPALMREIARQACDRALPRSKRKSLGKSLSYGLGALRKEAMATSYSPEDRAFLNSLADRVAAGEFGPVRSKPTGP
jgi:hypothetical protein